MAGLACRSGSPGNGPRPYGRSGGNPPTGLVAAGPLPPPATADAADWLISVRWPAGGDKAVHDAGLCASLRFQAAVPTVPIRVWCLLESHVFSASLAAGGGADDRDIDDRARLQKPPLFVPQPRPRSARSAYGARGDGEGTGSPGIASPARAMPAKRHRDSALRAHPRLPRTCRGGMDWGESSPRATTGSDRPRRSTHKLRRTAAGVSCRPSLRALLVHGLPAVLVSHQSPGLWVMTSPSRVWSCPGREAPAVQTKKPALATGQDRTGQIPAILLVRDRVTKRPAQTDNE